jgi:hypothetical protein
MNKETASNPLFPHSMAEASRTGGTGRPALTVHSDQADFEAAERGFSARSEL